MEITTISGKTKLTSDPKTFITQAYPTNFHTFSRMRYLGLNESAENYKQVTNAERQTIEARDSQWKRPSQWLIDLFNSDPNGCYNEATGYGELNGLKDMTAADMEATAQWGNKIFQFCFCRNWADTRPGMRTNLTPINNGFSVHDIGVNGLCVGQWNLEVLRLNTDDEYIDGGALRSSSSYVDMIFNDCPKLKKVIGVIRIENLMDDCTIFEAYFDALEQIYFQYATNNVKLNNLPSLSIDSLQYLVDNARNSKAITVSLHNNAYARLTDELIASAAAKNITFITT